MRFVFITDIHAQLSSNVRTGNILSDILAKLSWCVEYANSLDAVLLIGGDVNNSAVVPYEITQALAVVFRRAKYTPICIKGNHDQMYRSDAHDIKSALNCLYQTGVLRSIDGQTLDFGDCLVTNEIPIPQVSAKPVLFLYHGFLDISDGKFSISSELLRATQVPTLVLLGHDHVMYEPLQIGWSTVLRPGSLLRDRRIEASYRQPYLYDIAVLDGGFSYNLIEIPARPFTDIFRERSSSESVSEVENDGVDYDRLVMELQHSFESNSESFEDIVSRIADPQCASYILDTLHQFKSLKNK